MRLTIFMFEDEYMNNHIYLQGKMQCLIRMYTMSNN